MTQQQPSGVEKVADAAAWIFRPSPIARLVMSEAEFRARWPDEPYTSEDLAANPGPALES
jgi:hypothetical protein